MARPSESRTSRQGELDRDDTQQQRPQNETTEHEFERVARRAYERFQERGSEHGRDQEDWFAAEQELREGARERSGEDRKR